MCVFSEATKKIIKPFNGALIPAATGPNSHRAPSTGTLQTPVLELLKSIVQDAQPNHSCIYQRRVFLAVGRQCDHELQWSWTFLRTLSHRIDTCSLVWKFKTSHGWNSGSFSNLRGRTQVMLLLPNSSHHVKLLPRFICVSQTPQLPTFSFSQAHFQSSCNNVIILLNENLDSCSTIVPLATSVTRLSWRRGDLMLTFIISTNESLVIWESCGNSVITQAVILKISLNIPLFIAWKIPCLILTVPKLLLFWKNLISGKWLLSGATLKSICRFFMV